MMLLLSCGHYVDEECSCAQSSSVNYIDLALNMFRGKWREVIEGYGVDLPQRKKAGPCPVCGGRDRFIFDDKEGLGTWFCRQCDVRAGGGLILLSRIINKSTHETAKEICGDCTSTVICQRETIDYEKQKIEGYKKAEIKASLIMRGCIVNTHPYLLKRWLSNKAFVSGGDLIVPCLHEKRLVNVQTINSHGKKFLYGGRAKDIHHFIKGDNSRAIAIVEGLATGITVNMLTGFSVFCCFMASNIPLLSKRVCNAFPDKKIIIFADHDNDNRVNSWLGGAGVHYAEVASKEFGAKICHPTEREDWDDTRQRIGNAKTIEMMRSQIAKLN